MCDPMTAMAGASLAIGAAQGVAKYGAASQDASAMQAYQDKERAAAEVDRNLKWNALSARQVQETDAASQALFDNSIRATKARGTAEASAADTGVSGNSVESVARDVYAQQGRIDSTTLKNTQMSIAQLQDEKASAGSQYASRTNFSPIKQPSMLGLGLDIAGAGLQAYDVYDKVGARNALSKRTA